MRKTAVTTVFVLLAAATATAAGVRVDHAVRGDALHLWLAAGYSALKAAVTISFAIFVALREPAQRPSREPLAFGTCALAMGSLVALRAPQNADTSGLALAGESVALIGCAFLLRSVVALGRSFSVLPEARQLVTTGPYRYVRHPVYLGEITACAGLVLASPGLRNLALAGCFAFAQATRIRLEERALTFAFPEYAEYAVQTGRLLPRWSALTARVPRAILDGEQGQALVEYALVLILVSVLAVGGLTAIGVDVAGFLTRVVNAFP